MKPIKKDKVPIVPKKCIGRFPNFPTNVIDIKSNGPLMNRGAFLHKPQCF
jgi:hypothetical protein